MKWPGLTPNECVVVEEMYTRIKPCDWQLKQNAAQLIPDTMWEFIRKLIFTYYIHIFC